jgi:hypothetical protein
LLAFLAQDVVYVVGFGNKATATSCGIRISAFVYGRANLLAFLVQDAVCAVGFGNKATATSCSIRNPRVWQKVSGRENRGQGRGQSKVWVEVR